MKKRYLWLAGAAWLFSGMAMALTLDEAKQQGRVGETLSGYIAPVKQDAETLALVKRINAGRAEKYQEVATAASCCCHVRRCCRHSVAGRLTRCASRPPWQTR